MTDREMLILAEQRLSAEAEGLRLQLASTRLENAELHRRILERDAMVTNYGRDIVELRAENADLRQRTDVDAQALQAEILCRVRLENERKDLAAKLVGTLRQYDDLQIANLDLRAKLEAANAELPGLRIRAGLVSELEERVTLAEFEAMRRRT